jgi:hypothetical protein
MNNENTHTQMNNENTHTQMNNETFINKAGKATFNAVDTIADVSGGLFQCLGSLVMGALKATTYFIIGGALLFVGAVAFSPKPTALEKERLENLVIIDKREMQKKDDKISKLEQEGTVSRAVRKLRGKPLE